MDPNRTSKNPEGASCDHDSCDNTDLHNEITALKTAIATAHRDFVDLQNEVQRLEQENVVFRWCHRNQISANHEGEDAGKDSKGSD